ncbi:type II toxin-antitoxin system VapC family toxin [Leifsonia sp. NPDC058292]|uniref:type II toxin-antitoxin system VapC family toxin n=1 Tax=Leifsonia sp. NPDC058292 TaxID=3346428 RepID=UPI0036D8DC46
MLDTNVVSEMMRPRPDPVVLAWLDAQVSDGVFITAVTAAELLYGVERLAAGHRRAALENAIGQLLDIDFGGRILPFDAIAAVEYARIVIECERYGRPIGMADAMIAASSLAAGVGTIATRNVSDFQDSGAHIVDPWAT